MQKSKHFAAVSALAPHSTSDCRHSSYVGMLLAVSQSLSRKRTVNLLDLDDHLLCEVFKSLSVHDKQQNVQRTCLRFRSALQRPSIVEAWGSIRVTPPQDIEARRSIGRLVTWILERKSGISDVNIVTVDQSLSHPKVAATGQLLLHALAAALADERVPVGYLGGFDAECVHLAPLSFAHMGTEVVAALQKSVELLAICCTNFQPEHWDILCSLHHVSDMAISLRSTAPSELLDSYQIQSVQLRALRDVFFNFCDVSLQPVLQHLSAMTGLTALTFEGCSKGLSALSGGMPPLHELVSLTFQACELTVLPPLRCLPCLQELHLDENPELRDVQRGLRGVTSLTKLSMRDRTPVGEGTLGILQQLPCLREFDVRDCHWPPSNAALLGRLQRCSDAQQFTMIIL